ncbi:hypothetical protein EDI_257970 [Entamoeba dispar SAW760]|uniref:Uncharacterized protein n=1 Tax=Entamoeba dispar (strain ATCC PRA-260 / SAW760) TaxID=370354 RepID=B0EQ32_ENTDS|nr:uncharacterized protein EDI_257970 [Entamoeba dispar SAW760]EDR23364.1 hypothetical protein EDI_257970 [Entamoeba dispar SAW760]|eukprot:EDR23364.1 hypothetical protein EDI_257970 [Entamoeba dispar SAW760]
MSQYESGILIKTSTIGGKKKTQKKSQSQKKIFQKLTHEEEKQLSSTYQQLIKNYCYPTFNAIQNLLNENRTIPLLLNNKLLEYYGYNELRVPFGIENESIPLDYSFIEDMKKKIKNTPPQLVLTIEEIGYQVIQLKGKIKCYFKGGVPKNLQLGRTTKTSTSIICVSNDRSFIRTFRVLSKTNNNNDMQNYFEKNQIDDTFVNSVYSSHGRNLYYTSNQFIIWFNSIKQYIINKLNELKYYSKAIIYMHEYFKQFFTEYSTDIYDLIFFNDTYCYNLSLLSPSIQRCIKILKEKLNVTNHTQELQFRDKVEVNLNNMTNKVITKFDFLRLVIDDLKSTNSLLSEIIFKFDNNNLSYNEFTSFENKKIPLIHQFNINQSIQPSSDLFKTKNNYNIIFYDFITNKIIKELETKEIINLQEFVINNKISELYILKLLPVLNLHIEKVWKYPYQINTNSNQLINCASQLLNINNVHQNQIIFVDSFEYLSDALQESKILVKNDSTDHTLFVQRENVIQQHLYAIKEDGTLLRPLINEKGISNSEMINWIIEIIQGISITIYPPQKIYFIVHEQYKKIFCNEELLNKLKTIYENDMINVIYIEDTIYPIIPINIIFNKVLELILFKNLHLTTQTIESEIRYCLNSTLLNTLLYEWYELRKLKTVDCRKIKSLVNQFTHKTPCLVIINGIKEGVNYNDPPSKVFNLDCVPPIFRPIMSDLICVSPELKLCKSKDEQIKFFSKYSDKYFFKIDEIFLNKCEPQKRLLIE